MSPRAQVLLLGGLLALTCLVLGAFAWRSVDQERVAATSRYQVRGEAALDAAERALGRALREVPRPFSETGGVAPTSSGAPLGSDHEAFLAGLRLLEEGGAIAPEEPAGLSEALREGPPAERAAALGAWAAALDRAGHRAEARAAWREVVALGPEHRDDRGLRRDLAARYFLAESVAERLELLEELAPEYRGWGPGAGLAAGVLWRRVLRELRPQAPAALEAELTHFLGPDRGLPSRPAPGPTAAEVLRLRDHLEAERGRELQRRAAWVEAAGIQAWFEAAGPGETASFELPGDPIRPPLPPDLRRVVALRGDELRLATLREVLAAGLAAPELEAYAELGFTIRRAEVPAPEGAQEVAQRTLSGALAGVELRAYGSELDAFVAADSRRLRTTLWLLGGTLALIVLGSGVLLRSVLREAETARAQRNFVAAVTHELKTPLASIRLLGELLAGGEVEAAQAQDFAERVVQETDRLTGLVQTVLQLARAEQGPGETARIQPSELADEAAEATRLTRAESETELRLDLSPCAEIRGDRSALLGVLVNLIDNALKYGAGPLELELRGDARRVRFSLRDHGPGVPRAAREQIFEAFWRGEDEMTRTRTGVGLGLALGRAVAEAHAGSLSYQEPSGGGARFVLELPVAPPEEESA